MLLKSFTRFRRITHPGVARKILDVAGPGRVELAPVFGMFTRGSAPDQWSARWFREYGTEYPTSVAERGATPQEALGRLLGRLRKINQARAARLTARPDRDRARIPELGVRSERRTGRPVGGR